MYYELFYSMIKIVLLNEKKNEFKMPFTKIHGMNIFNDM